MNGRWIDRYICLELPMSEDISKPRLHPPIGHFFNLVKVPEPKENAPSRTTFLT